MPPQMAWAESQAEGPRANPRRSGGAPGTCRIALSGAPVENRVPELRSHFEFNLDGGPPCGASRCRRRPRGETTQKRRRFEDQGAKAALSRRSAEKVQNFPPNKSRCIGAGASASNGAGAGVAGSQGRSREGDDEVGRFGCASFNGDHLRTCATYAACTSRARGAPRFFLRATSRQRCAPGEKKNAVDASRIPTSPS